MKSGMKNEMFQIISTLLLISSIKFVTEQQITRPELLEAIWWT